MVLFADALKMLARMPKLKTWRVSLADMLEKLDRDKGGRTYRVFYLDDYGEYVGVCDQYPSLSWLAKNPESARKGIESLVAWADADLGMEIVDKAGGGFPKRRYRLIYDDAEKVYTATCDGYPTLKWTSKSRRDAMLGIKSLVRDYDRWTRLITMNKKKKRGGGATAAPADGTAAISVQFRTPSNQSKRTK